MILRTVLLVNLSTTVARARIELSEQPGQRPLLGGGEPVRQPVLAHVDRALDLPDERPTGRRELDVDEATIGLRSPPAHEPPALEPVERLDDGRLARDLHAREVAHLGRAEEPET